MIQSLTKALLILLFAMLSACEVTAHVESVPINCTSAQLAQKDKPVVLVWNGKSMECK